MILSFTEDTGQLPTQRDLDYKSTINLIKAAADNTKKILPLILCNNSKETFFNSVRPARTPRAEVNASARVDPNHTAKGTAALLRATTANWVLSPNSANVMSRKVLKNIP